jgi:uncharacterized protein (TIGR02145 family)
MYQAINGDGAIYFGWDEDVWTIDAYKTGKDLFKKLVDDSLNCGDAHNEVLNDGNGIGHNPETHFEYAGDECLYLIEPNIKITYPVGGETWHLGETVSIQWEYSGITGEIQISFDFPGTQHIMGSTQISNMSYSFQIPLSYPVRDDWYVTVSVNDACETDDYSDQSGNISLIGGPCPGIPTVTYGGQVYNTVQIGSQCWLKENLNYAVGNSWCYDDNSSNCDIYGRVYDWNTALTACPPGWHLPSDAEWDVIVNYLGGSSIAGGKMKEAGFAHWKLPNTGATNESGFTALPGGTTWNPDIPIPDEDIGLWTAWWSSSPATYYASFIRAVGYDRSNVVRMQNGIAWHRSVRCMKD